MDMARRRTASSTGNARPGSAPRGHGYPVKPKWQADVKARLADMGRTVKWLAGEVGCVQSTMHDTLNNPEARHSHLVPKIHRVLGWNPPGEPEATPIILSADALEVAGMYDRLPEEVRKSMRDQASAFLAALAKAKP
jgi:lambda repressor-like predicted transcriptional regulator